ncbi:MAG: hypothetical protein JXR03_10520 [Cyclobacteriaceae bacterium]
MKTLIESIERIGITLFILIGLISCEEPITEAAKGQLSLHFQSLRTGDSNDRIIQATPSTITISIEGENASPLWNLFEMDLIPFGDGYLTSVLPISTGNYQITDFIVLDSEGKTLYACPLENSSLEYLVSDPLPIFFSVIESQLTSITPQVVGLENHIAEDFGYSEFTLDIVSSFQIHVATYGYENKKKDRYPINALVQINGDQKVLFSDYLGEEEDVLTLLDGYDNYTISATFPGHGSYYETFDGEEIKKFDGEKKKGVLEIELQEE